MSVCVDSLFIVGRGSGNRKYILMLNQNPARHFYIY